MALRRAIQDGDWSSSSTWENGQVPQTGDDVIITQGVTVTFNIASFSGGNLTLEPYSALQFPPTATQRSVTWSGDITLQAHATVDGNPMGEEFVTISCATLTVDETASWFGSLKYSPRRNNLGAGEWGLTVAAPISSGATQITLRPTSFYSINPSLVSLLAGKSLYIALDEGLHSNVISSADWDAGAEVLTINTSSPLPNVPAGVSCLIVPDPFSTHVHLTATSVTSPIINLAAHTVQIVNDTDLNIFGDGIIVFNTVANKVSGRNIWFCDFRASPTTKVASIQANAIAVADTSAITYDIMAMRIGFEGIYGGFSSAPLIIADILKIKRNHALSGSGFQITAGSFSGYLNLNGSSFTFEAKQADITQLSWGSSFDPTNCRISVGSEQFSSTLATTFDWQSFISFLASRDGTGYRGLIEFRNFGGMRLLRANYVGHEFVLYHDDFQPLKIEVPLTFRHAEVHWGKAEKSFAKIGEEGKIIAWGMLWEKDFRNIEASPPTCEATLTGNMVTLNPARPDFEVLEGQGDTCLITLPSPNSGRFWFFNEVNLTVPSNFAEPWIYDAGNGYIGFHTPATSATLSQLKTAVAKTENEKPLGWRWQATFPNDLAEIQHFVSRYDANYYAAVFLILSKNGWKCHAIIWSLGAGVTPVRKTMTYPSLTVISPENIALGITCHAFIREGTTLRRLAFQANIFDDWHDYPLPSPIPVTVEYANFSPTSVTLDLSQDIPRLTFYDGAQERVLLLDRTFVEYEKIALKSMSEVIQMFAANLKARLVLTGSATSGNYKSASTEKFAVTCIVVTGRGTVYFWDWVSGTRDPSNSDDLAQTKLVIEVNSTTPTVVTFTPIMFPMGLYIEARKAATDPFLGVYVYSD
jgi:hypothetical protein